MPGSFSAAHSLVLYGPKEICPGRDWARFLYGSVRSPIPCSRVAALWANGQVERRRPSVYGRQYPIWSFWTGGLWLAERVRGMRATSSFVLV